MQPAPPAGRAFSPLDEELELGAGTLSPRLVESVVRLGTWMPFERVPAALAFFTGVPSGIETARRLTETAGTALVAAETAAVARLERELPPVPAGPALQQLSVDGAMVPLVGGTWTEVKTVAIGTAIGAAAGFWRGRTGLALLGLTDFALALPRVVLLLLLASLWQPSAGLVIVVLGLVTASRWAVGRASPVPATRPASVAGPGWMIPGRAMVSSRWVSSAVGIPGAPCLISVEVWHPVSRFRMMIGVHRSAGSSEVRATGQN